MASFLNGLPLCSSLEHAINRMNVETIAKNARKEFFIPSS
jgi:hypothetical protein